MRKLPPILFTMLFAATLTFADGHGQNGRDAPPEPPFWHLMPATGGRNRVPEREVGAR